MSFKGDGLGCKPISEGGFIAGRDSSMVVGLICSLRLHFLTYLKEIAKMNDSKANTNADTKNVWSGIVDGWLSPVALFVTGWGRR